SEVVPPSIIALGRGRAAEGGKRALTPTPSAIFLASQHSRSVSLRAVPNLGEHAETSIHFDGSHAAGWARSNGSRPIVGEEIGGLVERPACHCGRHFLLFFVHRPRA